MCGPFWSLIHPIVEREAKALTKATDSWGLPTNDATFSDKNHDAKKYHVKENLIVLWTQKAIHD